MVLIKASTRTLLNMNLIEQLRSRREHLKELETQLSSPVVLSDRQKNREVNEAYAAEREVVEVGERYEKAVRDLEGARETISTTKDAELIGMAQQEIADIETRLPALEHDLTIALIPLIHWTQKASSLKFARGLVGTNQHYLWPSSLRTYTLYAETHGWKVELVSANRSDVNGFKEIIVEIKGLNAYSRLKYESGVHRVQRVPETEKAGRVHTSTVTVAILPEVEEVDVKSDQKTWKSKQQPRRGRADRASTPRTRRCVSRTSRLDSWCTAKRNGRSNKTKNGRCRLSAHVCLRWNRSVCAKNVKRAARPSWNR